MAPPDLKETLAFGSDTPVTPFDYLVSSLPFNALPEPLVLRVTDAAGNPALRDPPEGARRGPLIPRGRRRTTPPSGALLRENTAA